jgi:hypothetical protein
MLINAAQTLLDKKNIISEIVLRTDDYTTPANTPPRSRHCRLQDRELAGGQRELPEDLPHPDDHHVLHHRRAASWSRRSAC